MKDTYESSCKWRIPLLCLATLAIFAVTSLEPLMAQPYIYGLNRKGKLSVNGTVLDELAGSFDEDKPLLTIEDAWVDLAIEGSDRYALRRDGRISKNGKKIDTLSSGFYLWISMKVSGGTIFSLRQDGALAVDGDIIDNLPAKNFFFREIVLSGFDAYSLRSNGAVFKNAIDEPVFRFRGGQGFFGFGDGEELDTVWVAASVNPVDGDLYALRTDGQVFRGDEDADVGEETSKEAELPFPSGRFPEAGDFYVDIEFTADGSWKVLRANGEIYASTSPLAPLVNLPGGANDTDTVFTEIATLNNDFWAIRGDGRVYKNTDEVEILNLPKDLYGQIAIGDDDPDLSNFKNSKPVAAKYKPKIVVGTPLELPVIVTDVDKASEDLIVTAIADTIPEGATWDPMARILDWPSPGPKGTYTFKVQADDGVAKPVTFKYKIKVKEPDENPDKNKKPLLTKIEKSQPLVDFEWDMPIIVDDRDGDDLSITVDETAYPFTAGAVFDPSTRTFIWTPAFEDAGKVTVKFFVSDGTKTETLKVKLNIKNSLIF